MANKVVNFPKEKSKRARAYMKAEAKQVLMSLSLVSLFVGVILINDTVTRERTPIYIVSDNQSQSSDLNRAIASARPMNLFRDIEWEHDLAQKLGQEPAIDERVPASVSRNLSSLDQLRYGPLAGKYSVVNRLFKDDPKILEITYVDSYDVSDRPVFLNPEDFLTQYKDLVAVPFETYSLQEKSQSAETFRLLDKTQKPTGTAVFQMDEDGRLLSVRFSSLEP